MFTLRPEQVAALARNHSAGQLLEEFSKKGFHGLWEENGEEIQLLDPRGYVSRVRLDEHGRIAETISPSGERQEFAYDHRNRLAAYRAPAGLRLQWTYEDQDRLTSLTRNENQRWLFETNPEGDLTGIAYPDGSSNRMAYQGLANWPHTRTGPTRRHIFNAMPFPGSPPWSPPGALIGNIPIQNGSGRIPLPIPMEAEKSTSAMAKGG